MGGTDRVSWAMMDQHATLIYDGECGFCRKWINRVRRCDHRKLLQVVPYQTRDLEQRFPGVRREDCEQRIHVMDAEGTIYGGAAAAREVLRRLPGGRFWTLPFLLPGALPVAERVYAWVAHRYGPLPRPDEGD